MDIQEFPYSQNDNIIINNVKPSEKIINFIYK